MVRVETRFSVLIIMVPGFWSWVSVENWRVPEMSCGNVLVMTRGISAGWPVRKNYSCCAAVMVMSAAGAGVTRKTASPIIPIMRKMRWVNRARRAVPGVEVTE
jgi:hypothetical protein